MDKSTIVKAVMEASERRMRHSNPSGQTILIFSKGQTEYMADESGTINSYSTFETYVDAKEKHPNADSAIRIFFMNHKAVSVSVYCDDIPPKVMDLWYEEPYTIVSIDRWTSL